MNIVWLTWKDRKHPLAGGAERVNQEIAKRCVLNGHHVTFITGGFSGATEEELMDGCRVIRLGSMWSVHWFAYWYYKKNLQGWADVIIEEVNTLPFFAAMYPKRSQKKEQNFVHSSDWPEHFLFFHQLNRELWFHQMPFPFGLIGYVCEPLFLFFNNNKRVLTISESTKEDLGRYCFDPGRVMVIAQGNVLTPIADPLQVVKYERPTILSLSAVRSMKRVDHIITAFEIAKEEIADLQLVIAGDVTDRYGQKVLERARYSIYGQDIIVLGQVSREKKMELMQRSHIIAITSIKEGWGLTVTEANSQGTPAVVYDVDGLRDSVQHGKTGVVCKENTPLALAKELSDLIHEKLRYEQLRKEAWKASKALTFDQSYRDFMRAITRKKW